MRTQQRYRKLTKNQASLTTLGFSRVTIQHEEPSPQLELPPSSPINNETCSESHQQELPAVCSDASAEELAEMDQSPQEQLVDVVDEESADALWEGEMEDC